MLFRIIYRLVLQDPCQQPKRIKSIPTSSQPISMMYSDLRNYKSLRYHSERTPGHPNSLYAIPNPASSAKLHTEFVLLNIESPIPKHTTLHTSLDTKAPTSEVHESEIKCWDCCPPEPISSSLSLATFPGGHGYCPVTRAPKLPIFLSRSRIWCPQKDGVVRTTSVGRQASCGGDSRP